MITFNNLFCQVVSTIAGPLGMRGEKDGTGIAASFFYPDAIHPDASGNIYVADNGRNTIRKITPAGVVTTFAGFPAASGYLDGTGTAARFSSPNGICVTPSGNIYVADTYNQRIRQITPSGVVTTFAGSGVVGSTNATGTSATFNYPGGMCSDAAGNIYVIEPVTSLIRKITPSGVVSTFASSSDFSNSRAICSDAADNIYVASLNGHKIMKITPAGVISTFAGSGTAGSTNATGVAASFYSPYAVCSDASGNIYVTDRGNCKIRKITPAGSVTTLAGSGIFGVANGIGTAASFNALAGLCADVSGNIFASSGPAIRRITSAGVVSNFVGGGGYGSENLIGNNASFSSPEGICSDASGNMYVADISNNKIRKITPSGVVSTFAGIAGSGSSDGPAATASFDGPSGVCFDPSGNMYVADRSNHKIRKITPGGTVSTLAGSGSVGAADGPGATATFNYPVQVCTDAAGNVYVSDEYNNKIRKITPAGVVSTLAGSGTVGSVDATGPAASFNTPYGICADAAGNIYVNDRLNYKIRKITAAGVVTTLAGSGVAGAIDATGTAASFGDPYGICTDVSGNMYVADRAANKIRKVTPAGVVTSIAGTGFAGDTDGMVVSAEFNMIRGICTDLSGNIYVVHRDDHKVRKITFCSVPASPVNATSALNATVCSGNVTTLTASSTGTVSWFTAATGGTAIATGTTITTSSALTAGTYTYYAEAMTCTVSAARTAITFTVNATPIITVNSGSMCSGKTFTISPGGASTYTVSGGSFNVSPTATTNYSVTGTSALGCLSSNTVVSTVSVYTTPTITVNSGAICSGTTFTIVPGGANTYTVSGGAFNVSPTTTTNYNVTGTSALGCVSSNTAVSTVSVNAPPTITVNSGAICSGKTFTISPGGATTYTISGGSFNVTPTATTSYSVTGTSAQGCVSLNAAVSTVSVNANPTVIASSNNSVICSGQTATLSATGANTYTWSTGSNASGIVVSPTLTTTYSLTGTNASGCSNNSMVTQSVSVCTGIETLAVTETINIYPNPTNGLFFVELPYVSNIIITDALGRIVLNERMAEGKQEIDLQNEAKGIYFIKIESTTTYKMIKIILY